MPGQAAVKRCVCSSWVGGFWNEYRKLDWHIFSSFLWSSPLASLRPSSSFSYLESASSITTTTTTTTSTAVLSSSSDWQTDIQEQGNNFLADSGQKYIFKSNRECQLSNWLTSFFFALLKVLISCKTSERTFYSQNDRINEKERETKNRWWSMTDRSIDPSRRVAGAQAGRQDSGKKSTSFQLLED